MNAPLRNTTSLFSRAGTTLFAVWFCGAFCLVCCVPRVEAGDPESANECAAHSCCLEKSGDADAPGKAAKGLASSDSRACCAPFGQTALLTEKHKHCAAYGTVAAKWTPPAPRITYDSMTVAHRMYVPDRGGTYLECCVFLIEVEVKRSFDHAGCHSAAGQPQPNITSGDRQ